MNTSFSWLIFTSYKPSIFGLLLPYSFLNVYRHLHVYSGHYRALWNSSKVSESLFSTKHLLKLQWQRISVISTNIRWVNLDGGREGATYYGGESEKSKDELWFLKVHWVIGCHAVWSGWPENSDPRKIAEQRPSSLRIKCSKKAKERISWTSTANRSWFKCKSCHLKKLILN